MNIDIEIDPAGIPGVNKPDETLEVSEKKEISETLRKFKQRDKDEQARFKNATDSEFWFCVCFMNREEKEEFIAKVGAQILGDKYIDGRALAELLGIELSKTDFRPKTQERRGKFVDEIGTI